MDRINTPTASTSTGVRLFTEGTPGGTPATLIIANWLNDMQEEIMSVIEDSDAGNASPSAGSRVQLKEAIIAMIAEAVDGLGGGGGGGTGTLVKRTEATLGSNSATTSTSITDSGLQVDYTAITAANDRYIDVYGDWEIKDATGNKAEGFVDLQYNSGSSWATIKTFTMNIDILSGQKMIATQTSTLATTYSSTSTSEVATGLQIDYTSVLAANKRFVDVFLIHSSIDNSGVGANTSCRVQYYNGSSWTTIREYKCQTLHGGSTSARHTVSHFDSIEHDVSDDTPQYRIVILANDSGDTGELAATSYLRVREFQTEKIATKRIPFSFTHLHTASDGTPQYRLVHRVTSGVTSTLYAGSVLRVREFN